jgi:hypothetical protein
MSALMRKDHLTPPGGTVITGGMGGIGGAGGATTRSISFITPITMIKTGHVRPNPS